MKMDDSLESLLGKFNLYFRMQLPFCVCMCVCVLEKATNPRNKYEDWEFIMGFCDKVNGELQG